jgi:hypothetical protein
MVMESEPDVLRMDTSIPVVPTPANDVDIVVTTQGHEDRLDTNVIPEAEPDLPSHEIKTEGSTSNKEGDEVQDSSPSSKSFVDIEVQPEAQVLEETFYVGKAESGIASENILPETLPFTVIFVIL